MYVFVLYVKIYCNRIGRFFFYADQTVPALSVCQIKGIVYCIHCPDAVFFINENGHTNL